MNCFDLISSTSISLLRRAASRQPVPHNSSPTIVSRWLPSPCRQINSARIVWNGANRNFDRLRNNYNTLLTLIEWNGLNVHVQVASHITRLGILWPSPARFGQRRFNRESSRGNPNHFTNKYSPPAQQRCIYVDATWIYVLTWTDFCQPKIHVNAT